MGDDRVSDSQKKVHDGSWSRVKRKRVLELLDMDTSNFENPQIYWHVIEKRLETLKLSTTEMAKLREVLLEMMFDC